MVHTKLLHHLFLELLNCLLQLLQIILEINLPEVTLENAIVLANIGNKVVELPGRNKLMLG